MKLIIKSTIKNSFGFTLIELLVVISIIGFLSTLAVVSLKNAREKSRDARRASDLKQLKTAINLYYNNHNFYPGCVDAYINGTTDCLSLALISDGIMAKLPIDPKFAGGGWGNDYQYSGSGSVFSLRARLESNMFSQTHDYPNGTSCDSGIYPTCGWYGDCIYKGYGPSCALTLSHGSTQ